MTKVLSNEELRILIQNYKILHCVSIPRTKPELLALAMRLGLPTTKLKLKKTDPNYESTLIRPVISNFTKKKLIEKISNLTGEPASEYEKYSKLDLTQMLADVASNLGIS